MTCNAIHITFCELNIMWLRYLVHWCKMMISPGISFIFQKFWYFGPKSVEREKRGLNSLYWCANHFLVTISHMSIILVHSCRMMKFVGLFFTFIKLLIFWVIKWGNYYGLWYSLHYIWGTFWFLEHGSANKWHHLKAFFKWSRGKVVKWQKAVPNLLLTCVILAG